MNKPTMTPGDRYKVTYIIPPQQIPREAVMDFLDVAVSGALIFSGWPAFGTTSIEEKYILEIEKVSNNHEIYFGRKVQ